MSVYNNQQLICFGLENITTAAQRKEFCFAMEGSILSGLTRSAAASTILLAQQPKLHTNLEFYSCSCSAYLVCGTMHSWADTTASQQLTTILIDADDNFTSQAVDPGLALGPVCVR